MKDLQPAGICLDEKSWVGVWDVGGGSGNIENGFAGVITNEQDWGV